MIVNNSDSISSKAKNLFGQFEKFILKRNHPCLMAKTVFSQDQVYFKSYEKLGDEIISKKILKDIDQYISTAVSGDKAFYSFVATFPNVETGDEVSFEKEFWNQLQCLHNLDDSEWDEKVSCNPADSNFSFSLRGHAFYIIGMHPNSSRLARQAPCPTIVFNLHSQFEQLRNMGAYHRVRDKIRKRDRKLQGNVNPMLADFGASSEARQYSGKAVDENWKCPFQSRFHKIKKLCVKSFLRKAE